MLIIPIVAINGFAYKKNITGLVFSKRLTKILISFCPFLPPRGSGCIRTLKLKIMSHKVNHLSTKKHMLVGISENYLWLLWVLINY